MAAFGAGALLAGFGVLMLRDGTEKRFVLAGTALAADLVLLGISRSLPASLALGLATAGGLAVLGLLRATGPRWGR